MCSMIIEGLLHVMYRSKQINVISDICRYNCKLEAFANIIIYMSRLLFKILVPFQSIGYLTD